MAYKEPFTISRWRGVSHMKYRYLPFIWLFLILYIDKA
jgi:hypothetical protein